MTERELSHIIDNKMFLDMAISGQSLVENQGLPSELYKLLVISAQTYEAQNDLDNASRVAQLAVVTDHKRPEAWSLLGNLDKKSGAYADAILCWRIAYLQGGNPRVLLAILQLGLAIGLEDGMTEIAKGLRVIAKKDNEIQSTLDLIEVQLNKEKEEKKKKEKKEKRKK